jgi:hypothetical protein
VPPHQRFERGFIALADKALQQVFVRRIPIDSGGDPTKDLLNSGFEFPLWHGQFSWLTAGSP